MTPDYSMMQQLLGSNLPQYTPAALHGTVAGLLSSGVPDIDEEDVATLLQCEFPPVIGRLLALLISNTREQLQEPDFSFQLLLPQDDASLASRVGELGLWCESFTAAFSAGFVLSETALGAEGREALTDIAQLSSLVDEAEDDMEDQEEDYMELVEYVRMAVVTLYQQLCGAAAETGIAPMQPLSDGDTVLH
jgi:uncharacterized protein YgfB (UPF0149 family)